MPAGCSIIVLFFFTFVRRVLWKTLVYKNAMVGENATAFAHKNVAVCAANSSWEFSALVVSFHSSSITSGHTCPTFACRQCIHSWIYGLACNKYIHKLVLCAHGRVLLLPIYLCGLILLLKRKRTGESIRHMNMFERLGWASDISIKCVRHTGYNML